MARAKVAVTIDSVLLREVDNWVAAGEFPNRSRAIQHAVEVACDRRRAHGVLLRELEKLDPSEETALAEERFVGEPAWPQW